MKYNNIIMICFTLSVLINIWFMQYMYPIWYPKEVNIPNGVEVNNFCKSKGYDFGWLNSQSCGINEVMCNRKVFDMSQFKCIKWE